MTTGKRVYRIGTDIGGTFTDFVAIDPDSGEMWLEKTLTTPAAPSQGIMNGLAALHEGCGVTLPECDVLVHGTTLIINALIERKGEKTALITSQGFRDVLEMRNGMRYDVYDLQIEYPEPLVPRALRFEIEERTLADGRIVQTPSDDQVKGLVDELLRQGVTSVAVCLLNSHVNGQNERAIEHALKRYAPGLFVSISSELLPQIKEYERTSTTVANAYVKPTVNTYLDQLLAGLIERDFHGDLFVMQSGGGVVSKDSAKQHPIRMLESGPAGGVAAARWWGERVGERNLLCFDMGGTTAKLCTVIDGRALVTDEYEAARLHHFKRGSGLAVNVPVLDLLEIGTGGGSIAGVDKLGLLRVGPQSAGAVPGPACYGRGGTRPTVTDADLVLGYLDPTHFLGGSMSLDLDAARSAIKNGLADQLKEVSTEELAYHVHNLANEDMAAAARLHLAERGEDATTLCMVACGGAGPVHAYGLAHKLGIRRLLVPPGAGVMSALGMLVEDLATEQVRSFRHGLDTLDPVGMNEQYASMVQETSRLLQAGDDTLSVERSVDLRYRGQGYNVRIPVDELGPVDTGIRTALLHRFEEIYRARYGRIYQDVPIDLVNLRVTVARRRNAEAFVPRPLSAQRQQSAPRAVRAAYFGPRWGTLECAVYDRGALAPGLLHDGPAFVEDRETTIVIGPEGKFELDALGIIVISVA